MTETLKVVILRASEATLDEVMRGSTKRPCDRCSAECWVAPSTADAITRLGLGVTPEYICLDCALAEGVRGNVLGPTDEQIAEIVKHYSKGDA